MSEEQVVGDIKQIRVNGELYNLKDQYCRDVLPTKQDLLFTSVTAVTITPTVGVVKEDSPTVRRYGNVVQVSFSFRKMTATPMGQNCFEGQLSGTSFIIPQYITGATYYNSSALVGQLTPEGVITVRVTGENLAAFNPDRNWATISFTFFLEDE